MSKCMIKGCAHEAVARGLCAMHYMRQRRRGDPEAAFPPGRQPKPRPEAAEVTKLREEVTVLRRRLETAQARIAELKASPQKRRQPAQAADKITALEREVIGLKFELAEALDRSADGGPSDEVLRLRHENASLRRQLALSRAVAKPRPSAGPSETEAKLLAQIRQLRARNRELNDRLRAVADAPKGTVPMTKADRRKILRCLHTDRLKSVSAQELTEACQIFNGLPIHVV